MVHTRPANEAEATLHPLCLDMAQGRKLRAHLTLASMANYSFVNGGSPRTDNDAGLAVP